MIRTFALECRTVFIPEKRSRAYEMYAAKVSDEKMLFCAMIGLQKRALLALESQGAKLL